MAVLLNVILPTTTCHIVQNGIKVFSFFVTDDVLLQATFSKHAAKFSESICQLSETLTSWHLVSLVKIALSSSFSKKKRNHRTELIFGATGGCVKFLPVVQFFPETTRFMMYLNTYYLDIIKIWSIFYQDIKSQRVNSGLGGPWNMNRRQPSGGMGMGGEISQQLSHFNNL